MLAPRWFDVFVPVERRDDGVRKEAVGVTEGSEVVGEVEVESGGARSEEEEVEVEGGKSGKA